MLDKEKRLTEGIIVDNVDEAIKPDFLPNCAKIFNVVMTIFD